MDTSGVTLGTNNNTFAAKFIDDAVINVGTGNDLQISHVNDVSLIRDTRAGAGATLAIGADKLFLRNKDGNENYLEATDNGSVKLFYDFAPKFETDTGGVKITGVATATSFSGSAAGLTSIPSAQLSGALPALDGSALTGVTASGSGIVVKHDGTTVGTAGTVNFSTNLDVTAVSAGIVTITASGSSGVSLSGSTNNTVATVTGANAIQGESNLTFDGTNLIATGQFQMGGGIVFHAGGTSWNTTHQRPQIQRQADGELRLGGGSDSASSVTMYTAPSAGGTLTEKFRIASAGQIGLGGANYGTSGQVLTSGGSGSAVSWTTISGGTDVGITTNLSGSFTASAGTAATINTLTGYSANDLVVEYTIYIKNGSDFQTQKLLAMRDGTTIHSTQFAVMFSSSLLVQCDATISSGNILLRATPETGVSGSTTYKIKREVM